MLRTALFQCLGQVSASIYPNDLGGNKELEGYVGHQNHDDIIPDGALPLIKTHGLPKDNGPAVYIVRDGRAACVSLWNFWHRRLPLEIIIAGKHRFGSWANHLAAWQPWDREQTLFLKYEDVLSDFPETLEKLSSFLNVEIISSTMPSRDTIARVDGHWVTEQKDWRQFMTSKHLQLFQKTNGLMMEKLGYK